MCTTRCWCFSANTAAVIDETPPVLGVYEEATTHDDCMQLDRNDATDLPAPHYVLEET